jgi:hypothetical protein
VTPSEADAAVSAAAAANAAEEEANALADIFGDSEDA